MWYNISLLGLFSLHFQYGYGQWQAIRMAIRRNPNFRFNYFFRSLPVEQLARRCEQLMKAAEKEVEQLERKAREDAGLPVEPENGEELAPIELPKFRDIQRRRRKEEKEKAVVERKQLQDTVDDLAAQIQAIQKRLKEISEGSTIARVSPDATDSRMIRESSARPDRKDDDAPETSHENKEDDEDVEEPQDGAPGPDGVFVKFPEYDGTDEPLEWKKPFTQFCLRNRKSVKQSLDPEDRKDKVCSLCTRVLALKMYRPPHSLFFLEKNQQSFERTMARAIRTGERSMARMGRMGQEALCQRSSRL